MDPLVHPTHLTKSYYQQGGMQKLKHNQKWVSGVFKIKVPFNFIKDSFTQMSIRARKYLNVVTKSQGTQGLYDSSRCQSPESAFSEHVSLQSQATALD